ILNRLGNHIERGVDLRERLLGAIGQIAHLVGHHRKTAPVFARPGRFDRGVEGQQIGLIGNIVDDGEDIAHLIGLARKAAELVGRAAASRVACCTWAVLSEAVWASSRVVFIPSVLTRTFLSALSVAAPIWRAVALSSAATEAFSLEAVLAPLRVWLKLSIRRL